MSSRGSSMASSQGGSSAGSSKASAKSQRNQPLFTKLGIYPLLQQHESHIDWKLGMLGQFVDLLQLLGLIVNPTFNWGPVWGDPLGNIFYFFVAPFFDSRWASGDTLVVAHLAFWVTCMLVFVLIISGVTNALSEHQAIPEALLFISKMCLHALCSFMILPLTMTTGSFMVCNKGRNDLFWFAGDYACDSAVAAIYFAVGCITLAIATILVYFAVGTLFDDNADTDIRNLTARSTSFTAETRILSRIALGICFHVFISQELPQVFAGIMCGICWLHALQYVVCLPYFHMKMNRWQCGIHLGAGTIALVAALMPVTGGVLEDNLTSTLAGVMGGFVTFLIGTYLPSFRIDSRFSAALSALQRGEILPQLDPVFPNGLPHQDLAFSRHKTLESDVNPAILRDDEDEESENSDEDSDDEELVGLHFPYISRIMFPHDVELASRFLMAFKEVTDNVPTDSMNGMCVRLFTKGMARFRRNGLVVLHFCSFLFNFAMRYRIALAEAEWMNGRLEASFALKYRSYRLQVTLKSALNMADTSHLKLFNSTLRLHKEILGHMQVFWTKLLSNNVDVVQLATIANSITGKREVADTQFSRVLMHSNANVLSRYARFLEQVMIDPAGAKMIRDQLAEEAEQRRNKMLNNKNKSGGQSVMRSVSSSVRERMQQRSTVDRMQGSTTISRLAYSMNVMFAVLLLLAIAIFIVEAIRSREAREVVDRMYAAGRVRSLASLGAYYAVELNHTVATTLADAGTTAINGTDTATQGAIAALQAALVAVSSQLYTHHTDLTHGTLKSTYQPHVDFVNIPRIEIFDPDFSGTSLSGNFRRTLTDLFNLGNQLSSTLSSIAATNNTANIDPSLLDYAKLNAYYNIPVALDKSMSLYEDESQSQDFLAFWVTTGIFVLGLLVVFVVYCIMVLNFNKIGVAKLSTLNLFTLIPRMHLETLQKSSQDLIDHFDEDDLANQSADPSLGQGDDDEEEYLRKPGSPNAPKANGNSPNNGMVPNGNGHSPDKPGGDQAQGFAVAWENMSMKDKRNEVDSADDATSVGDSLAGDEEEDIIENEEKTAAKNNNEGRTVTLQDILSGLGLAFSLAFILTISIATFALVLRIGYSIDDTENILSNAERRSSLQNQLYRTTLELSKEARLFTQTGNPTNLKAYRDLLQEDTLDKSYRDLQSLDDITPTTLEQLLDERTIIDDLLTRQIVALHLAAEATDLPAVDRIYLPSAGEYNFTKLKPTVNERFYSFVVETPPYSSKDYKLDAALNNTAKLGVARSLVFDDLYDAHFDLLERIRVISDIAEQDDKSKLATEDDTRRDLFAITLALYITMLLLVTLFNLRMRNASMKVLKFFGAIGTILLVACIAVLIVLFAVAPSLESTYDKVADLHIASNRSFASLSLADEHARAFAQWGNKNNFHKYQSVVESNAWEHSLNSLMHVFLNMASYDVSVSIENKDNEGTAHQNNDGSFSDELTLDRKEESITNHKYVMDRTIDIRRGGEDVFSLGEAAVLQTVWSKNYDSQVDFKSIIDGVYDRVREPTSEEDYVINGVGSDMYTNNVADQSKNDTELHQLSIDTMANHKHRTAVYNVLKSLDDVVSAGMDHLRSDIRSVSNLLENLGQSVVILSVVTLLILVATGMYVAFATIYNLTSSSAAIKNATSKNKTKGILFEALMLRTRAALSVIVATLIAVFVFDIIVVTGREREVHNLNLASKREWSIARTLSFAHEVWYGPSEDIPTATLIDLAHEMEQVRMKLYMGDAGFGSSYNVLNTYSSHNPTQFQSSSYNREAFRTECPAFAVETNAKNGATPSLATYGVTSIINEVNVNEIFPDGVDGAYVQWILSLHGMSAARNNTMAREDFSVKMTSSAIPLVHELASSTLFLHNAATDDVNRDSAIHYTLAALVTLAIVASFFAVFRPMIHHLLNEEEGTKMLLRMIPQAVRQDVPAIAEYLETGSISQNERMQKINDAVADLSVVSLIVINDVGSVLRMSRATQDIFGYDTDEVMGRNIKMLMPESIAKNHDGYLANYKKTGIKKVIDNARRVTAQHKDGTTFPVEIMVREFRISPIESNYLGFVRNITTEMQFERATKLNEAVSDMSHIPVLVINPAGSIFRVNRAACETFQYTASELANKNIKMLMPTKYAKGHDGYLEKYQRTRIKNIIDSKRNLFATRRNGDEFPAEVTVREMLSDKGTTQYFVGYVRDITSDLLFQQNVMANEAVIQISPTPVISIHPQGTITMFSPAAEAVWGWEASEVVGRNIRILMNDDDAKNHDGYLSRYMKTGIKSIVDSTRVVKAKKRNGEIFQAEANIKELRRDDHISFIGYLRDLSKQMRIEHVNQTNDIAFAACPLPVICINDVGTIQRFNLAAERMLGYRSEQVIGHNIKMMQPAEIAANHDEYLERYRETGIKNIIDSKRRTVAVARSGKKINIEIQVREVVVDDIMSSTGKKRIFVGYVRDVSEEMRMLKANELNDAITDLCTVPMISIDTKGTILTFSAAAATTFGHASEHVVGKNVKMLMPEEIAVNHDGYLAQYVKTGEKHIIDSSREVTAKRADGTLFPVEVKVREIQKQGMDPVYVGYCRETSQEILIEDAQNLIRTVIGTSPVPIVAINTKGIIQVFSSEAEKVFQWKADDLIGKNVKNIMPQDIARRHDQYLKQYKKTGIKSIIDSTRTVQALRRDGLNIAVEIVVKEIRKDKDKDSMTVPDDALYVGYLRDKSQEYILRQSNELKDIILKESSVPMVQIDTVGKIIFVNPACLAEFQYTMDELLGQNVKILTPKAIRVEHDMYLKRYEETGKKSVIDNIRKASGVRKDGSEFPIEISVRELVIDGVKTFFGYIRNYSGQLRIEDEKFAGDTIIRLSASPLIIINEIGTVTTFNNAACACFGYSEEEVVGQNIKMLQPDEVAAIHDEYLSNYKKYRLKSVIDTTRRVMAKKKNKRLFPAEIMVRELGSTSDGGLMYAGYIRDVTDEFRLRVANELADTVSNLSPIPLIAMSNRGIILKFSAAAEEQFGYQASEVIGQNIKMLQPASVAARHDEYLDRYLRTGVKTVVDRVREVTSRHRDGTEFPTEITVREIKKEGTEHTFIGFVRDLRKEQAERSMARINSTTLDMMPTPLIVIDPVGTVQTINRAVTTQFGYTAPHVEGKNIKMIMPDEIAVNHDNYLETYTKTKQKHVVDGKREVLCKHKDGSLVPIEIMVKEMRSDELDKTFFFGFLRELKEDHAMQHAFQLNEMVTSMSLYPIIVISTKGQILKFSELASKKFGYSVKEVAGKNIKMLMPEKYAQNHDGYLQAYQDTHIRKVIGKTRDIECLRKDGSVFPAELQVLEISVKGSTNVFVGFLKDVTEQRKKAEDAQIIQTINSLSGLALIMIDPLGIVQRCNDAVAKAIGYTQQDLVGKNVKMIMPTKISDRHDGYLSAFQRTGRKNVIDKVVRTQAQHKDGRVIQVEIGVRELQVDGVGQRFIGFIRDISEEAELEQSDRVNTSILTLSHVPIVLIDHVGTVLQFSDLACKCFGCNENDIVGHNVKKLMPESIAEHHDGYLKKYTETGIKTIIDNEREVTARRFNGSTFQAKISVKEIKSTDGSVYYLGYIKPL